jgi:hypothetical protein
MHVEGFLRNQKIALLKALVIEREIQLACAGRMKVGMLRESKARPALT